MHYPRKHAVKNENLYGHESPLSWHIICGFTTPVVVAAFDGLPITTRCEAESCTLLVSSPYTKGGKNDETIGLMVKYNRKSHGADFIAFLLPNNVDKNTELVVGFVKNESNGNQFNLVTESDEMIGLPINNCSAETCASVVQPEITSPKNKPINLFEKIKAKDHVWGTFRRNGKNETFMLPTYKFRDELAKLK